MTTKPTESPTMLDRLDKLERRNRRLRIVTLVSLVLAVLAAVAAFDARRRQMAEAEFRASRLFRSVTLTDLRLTDARGNTQATLSTSDEGSPCLSLWDPQWDANGHSSSVRLRVKDGRPTLGLADRDGKSRAMLYLRGDGSPSLEFRDAKGSVIWSAPETSGSASSRGSQ